MWTKCVVLATLAIGSALAIYPYFDTQDFIYNVPKVYRVSITLDKLLDYYERKPSKDPEFHIALGLARGQLEYTINELDATVPPRLKENLQNITRRMDRIRAARDELALVYRSKDYEYVAKAMLENLDVLAGTMEPLTLGTVGTQRPYVITFEQYVQEARTKMPTRKAADACTMQLLISAMESQTMQAEGSCELTPECHAQLLHGSAYAYQQTSRIRAAQVGKLFDCLENVDLNAYIYKLCVHVYKEAKSLEAWDHPEGTRTLFMQQVMMCAMAGYGEFIKPRWMNRILAWQEPKGCYSDERQPFLRITGFVTGPQAGANKDKEEEYRLRSAAAADGGKCNSLASGTALAALALHVRALLETDQAFQYSVLE